MKMPSSEAASMPPKTGGADAAPAEHRRTLRDHQREEADDEGEARHHHRAEPQLARPSTAASMIDMPCSRRSLANSMIRMPFLAASAISTTMPIWA